MPMFIAYVSSSYFLKINARNEWYPVWECDPAFPWRFKAFSFMKSSLFVYHFVLCFFFFRIWWRHLIHLTIDGSEVTGFFTEKCVTCATLCSGSSLNRKINYYVSASNNDDSWISERSFWLACLRSRMVHPQRTWIVTLEWSASVRNVDYSVETVRDNSYPVTWLHTNNKRIDKFIRMKIVVPNMRRAKSPSRTLIHCNSSQFELQSTRASDSTNFGRMPKKMKSKNFYAMGLDNMSPPIY